MLDYSHAVACIVVSSLYGSIAGGLVAATDKAVEGGSSGEVRHAYLMGTIDGAWQGVLAGFAGIGAKVMVTANVMLSVPVVLPPGFLDRFDERRYEA